MLNAAWFACFFFPIHEALKFTMLSIRFDAHRCYRGGAAYIAAYDNGKQDSILTDGWKKRGGTRCVWDSSGVVRSIYNQLHAYNAGLVSLQHNRIDLPFDQGATGSTVLV